MSKRLPATSGSSSQTVMTARAGDYHRVVELQIRQRLAGRGGLGSSVVGELEISAPGVLARLRPLGFPVAQQHQPMILESHADRLCLTRTAIDPRAPWGRCQ